MSWTFQKELPSYDETLRVRFCHLLEYFCIFSTNNLCNDESVGDHLYIKVYVKTLADLTNISILVSR